MVSIWQGENIKLRAVEITDIDGYFNMEDAMDTDLQRMGDIIRFPISGEKMKERVEKIVKRNPENDDYLWIIEDKDGNAVGDINTFGCSRRNGTFKYGIALKKPYWGKGYGKEAIKIVLNFFFRELRYQKAVAYIYSFNKNSYRLHEKLGFKVEGRLRRMIYTNGEFYDEIYFGMTREEFDEIYEKQDLHIIP